MTILLLQRVSQLQEVADVAEGGHVVPHGDCKDFCDECRAGRFDETLCENCCIDNLLNDVGVGGDVARHKCIADSRKRVSMYRCGSATC